MVEITIDGQRFQVEENKRVIQIARTRGIKIPGLCYHPALTPVGSCKLCVVECVVPGRKRTSSLACALKARDGMEVWTEGEPVTEARRKAFLDLVRMAPEAKVIRDLAAECGIDLGPPPDECIRCTLCVRVCREVVGAAALRMVKVNGKRLVVPIPNRCIGCGTCVSICPTHVIRMQDQGEIRTVSIRDEVIGRLPLARCESCGKLFATRKFLDHVAARTTTHVDVKQHHSYCAICAKLFGDPIKSAVVIKRL